MVSKKQTMQWTVWFMFSSLLLCALNTFCIFINESCYLILWGSEIHPNVIWLREESFFCLKICRHFQSSAFLFVYHCQLFWHTFNTVAASRHCLLAKIWSCSFFSVVWSYVRSKTSQLYHCAERMVLFKCWTCTLYSYSLKASSQFQAKHGCGITAIQTWVALRISGCIVWASAESTGAYSRGLCGVKS